MASGQRWVSLVTALLLTSTASALDASLATACARVSRVAGAAAPDSTEGQLLFLAASEPSDTTLAPAAASSGDGRLEVKAVPFDSEVAQGVVSAAFFPRSSSAATREKALSSATVQFQVKRQISADDLVFGVKFAQPVAASRVLLSAVGVATRALVGAGVSSKLGADKPSVDIPIISSAAVFNVTRPGQPDPEPETVTEGLGDAAFETDGEPWSAKKRLRYFRSAANRAAYNFEPGYTYTFRHSQNAVDFFTHKVGRVSLLPLLGGQPMQLRVADRRAGEAAFSFDVLSGPVLGYMAAKCA